MEWLIGLAGVWLFFQWVLPIAVLLIVAFVAYRWAQRRNAGEFASSEPYRHDEVEDRLEHHEALGDRLDQRDPWDHRHDRL